eukprot:sb/3469161/
MQVHKPRLLRLNIQMRPHHNESTWLDRSRVLHRPQYKMSQPSRQVNTVLQRRDCPVTETHRAAPNYHYKRSPLGQEILSLPSGNLQNHHKTCLIGWCSTFDPHPRGTGTCCNPPLLDGVVHLILTPGAPVHGVIHLFIFTDSVEIAVIVGSNIIYDQTILILPLVTHLLKITLQCDVDRCIVAVNQAVQVCCTSVVCSTSAVHPCLPRFVTVHVGVGVVEPVAQLERIDGIAERDKN